MRIFRKNEIKRIMSILLALLMVAGILTSSVFAEELPLESVEDATASYEVEGYPASEEILGKEATIDLETAESDEFLELSESVFPIHENLTTDDAYVSYVGVDSIVDGAGPFDDDDSAGNDSGSNNRIVRSFDSVIYNISYSDKIYTSGVAYENGYIWFRFVLPLNEGQACFDTAAMGWMATDSAHMWSLETDIANNKQILTCAKRIEKAEGNDSALPGSGLVYCVINVKAMNNGDILQPEMDAWMEHNDTEAEVCETHKEAVNGGRERIHYVFEPVKISAAPSYNVQLAKTSNAYVNSSGSFDFESGNDLALNKEAGIVNGRMQGYGITLQLYNSDAAKGLKGIEIPRGDISLSLTFSASYTITATGEKINLTALGYTPYIWSYDLSADTSSQQDGRSISGDRMCLLGSVPYGFVANSIRAKGAHQSIFSNDYIRTLSAYCWNGGAWSASQTGNKATFTISGYDVNPNWFPSANINTVDEYYNRSAGVFNNIGCFSAGEAYVVVPYELKGTPLQELYGTGTIEITVTDTDLHATSSSGQIFADEAGTNNGQVVQNDDKRIDVITLSKPGTYSQYILYTNYQKFGVNSDVYRESNCVNNGKDALAVNDNVAIFFAPSEATNGEDDNNWYAVDSLMKFDDEALELESVTASAGHNYKGSKTFLYAAKADGTGWASDEEMNGAGVEDLVYYETLAELESDGKICVGVLCQLRDENKLHTTASCYTGGVAYFHIKNDSKLVGNVYMTTMVSNVWTRGSVKEILSEAVTVPSVLDVMDGTSTWDQYREGRLTVIGKDVYKKAVYDASGYAGGDTGGRSYGDSLYLVAYRASIVKHVSQVDSQGDEKKAFDLDAGQYIVDYELIPSMEIEEDVVWPNTTTITITDTLPAGMSYIPASSVFGGTYVEAAKSGNPGSVDGGTSLEPQIIENADGTTTLIWEIENAAVEKNIGKLHFKAKMAADTIRNTIFLNSASIKTTEDIRTPSKGAGNYSEVSITTAKTSDISVVKTTDQLINETNSEITFNLSWSNNGNNNLTEQILLDAMPLNGDGKGSHYEGSYAISSLKVTLPSSSNGEYSVWYSTDPNAASLEVKDLISNGYTAASILGGEPTLGTTWKKAQMTLISGNENTISFPEDGVTAWLICGPIDKGSKITASIVINTIGNSAGNYYVNGASIGTNASITSTAYVVSRILRGTVWLDVNEDGERQTEESRISGITVSVIDEDGNVAFRGDGTELITVTKDDGSYEFTDMPSGLYSVRFTSGTTDLGQYHITTTCAEGVSEKVNSDAEGTELEGKLFSGDIYGIMMPEAEKILTIPYVVEYQDMGLVENPTYGNLTVRKTTEGNGANSSAEFVFTVMLSDKTISGTYGGMSFVNGVAVFTLKGGESVTAENLPNGVGYTVTEADYSADGYMTTKTGDAGSIVGNDELTASFTNTRNAEGSLTVSKTLSGNDTDSTKDFAFTVTLNDRTINGTYSSVDFTNGIASVTLKGGESKTIEGLPNGVGYTVTEADYSADGYVNSDQNGISGTIDENTPAVAAFTNTRNTYGDLTVSKTAEGNAASADKAFSFTVTLSDKTVSGTYGGMSFVNGVAVFTLKGGESVTAEDLPNGVGYTVTEADYSADGYVTTKTGDTGSIVGNNELTAAFTNTRNAYGDLTISKTVTGDHGDKTKYFSFTVTFDADGSYSYTGSKSGTISSEGTVRLKHGEHVTIAGLPAGTKYSVIESDNTGYRVHVSGDMGVIQANKTSNAQFTNTKSKVPITGDNSNLVLWVGIMCTALLCILSTAFFGCKKRRGSAHLSSK